MRILFLFFLLLSHLVSTHGQNITIFGKAQDGATGEPLEYAAVGIKGQSVGTITNLQGEFDFHISAEYRNEVLVISLLGYKNFEAPVWSLLNESSQIIKMDKSTTFLPEVVVIGDPLSGGDILTIALAHINENYPMKPFLMDGFYRDIKKVDGTYISLLEAAIKIQDEDYTEPRNKSKLRERVSLVEVRKSHSYEHLYTDFFDEDNLLEDLLLHNNVRYRQITADEALIGNIKREQNSYYNGHDIYVVSSAKDYHLKIFIDKEDFAIVHLEYEIGASEEVITKRKDLKSKFAGLKKNIDFKRYDGKLYLNYMTITSKINWYNIKTDELKFETELFQQLLINQVNPNVKNGVGSTEKMRSYGLQHQDLPYNKKFWDNYNVIKETPLDKKIMSDLEKNTPLEKQFEQNKIRH